MSYGHRKYIKKQIKKLKQTKRKIFDFCLLFFIIFLILNCTKIIKSLLRIIYNAKLLAFVEIKKANYNNFTGNHIFHTSFVG